MGRFQLSETYDPVSQGVVDEDLPNDNQDDERLPANSLGNRSCDKRGEGLEMRSKEMKVVDVNCTLQERVRVANSVPVMRRGVMAANIIMKSA